MTSDFEGKSTSFAIIVIIEIIGAIVIGVGLFLGGTIGGAIAGVGALFLLVLTIRHFSEGALAGLVICAVLGGLVSYLIGDTAHLFVGMFSGGMLGYIGAGNIFWWIHTEGLDEVHASYREIRSKVERRIINTEQMIKEVGKHGISPKNYQHTLIHQKELKENIQCNEKMVKSVNQAINSYKEINENLAELKGQIKHRIELSGNTHGASTSSSKKKKGSPYVHGDKWSIKKAPSGQINEDSPHIPTHQDIQLHQDPP